MQEQRSEMVWTQTSELKSLPDVTRLMLRVRYSAPGIHSPFIARRHVSLTQVSKNAPAWTDGVCRTASIAEEL